MQHQLHTPPQNYFSEKAAPLGTKRRVFYAYCRAVGVIVARLVENGKDACANAIVVAIDADDSMNDALSKAPAGTEAKAVKDAYTNFYESCGVIVSAPQVQPPLSCVCNSCSLQASSDVLLVFNRGAA